jgi:hypothetical protein
MSFVCAVSEKFGASHDEDGTGEKSVEYKEDDG